MICTLHKDHPENTEMAPAMLLEHFLNCIDRQRQEELLAELRTQAQAGSRCWMANHEGLARHVLMLQQVNRTDQAYISSLIRQVRKALAQASGPGQPEHRLAETRALLEAALSTRAQSVEQVDP
jgi:hypothetical protein